LVDTKIVKRSEEMIEQRERSSGMVYAGEKSKFHGK
jgi:hypothetical protein